MLKIITFIFVFTFHALAQDFDFLTPHHIFAHIKANSITDYQSTIQFLRTSEIEILGVNYQNKKIDLFLNEGEFSFLEEKFLLERDFQKDFMRSPDQEYKNPAEIEQILREYHQQYPQLTQLSVIGKSLEGKDIWALKISDHANKDEHFEPSILFNSLHHAREVMTPEVALDIIDTLLSHYAKDEKIKYLVDNTQIYVVPMLNVDGSQKVWDGSTMWRKNTRPPYGVDINRNYPYKWGECHGSSSRQRQQDYRGPSANSEPETAAMMGLVEQIRPIFDISYHSYSEFVLYPYGCDGQYADQQALYEKLGKQLGKLLDYRPGTPWELLYAVDGSDMDWMYHQYNTLAFALEINDSDDGFQPDFDSTRDKTVVRNRAGWMFLMERLFGSSVHGKIEGNKVSDIPIQVYTKNDNQRALFKTFKSDHKGAFYLILEPGKYDLEFNFGKNSSMTKEVIVQDHPNKIIVSQE